MGLFDFFKKKQDTSSKIPSIQISLKLQGPKFLRRNLATPDPDVANKVIIEDPNIQWFGQLISTTGNKKFQIRYFGNLMEGETITDTIEAVQKTIAIDIVTKEEILLFDKMLHGWDGFINNTYQDQKNINRVTDKIYKSKTNSDTFQILVLAYYNSGTREELLDSVNAMGNILLENGSNLNIQDAFDDAFDAVVIYAIDEQGNKFELINHDRLVKIDISSLKILLYKGFKGI